MTPEEVSFVKAILEEPDREGACLIYADWLEEQGEAARADYIRIQCALAHLSDDDPKRIPLVEQRRAVETKAVYQWYSMVPEHLCGFFELPSNYRPGALDRAQVQAGHREVDFFCRNAEKLFQYAPIHYLEILPQVGLNPDGGRFLYSVETGNVRRLLRIPLLKNLDLLTLHSPFDDINSVCRLLMKIRHLKSIGRIFIVNVSWHVSSFGPEDVPPRENWPVDAIDEKVRQKLRSQFGDRIDWERE